jgi:hypothetical protein
VVHGGERQKRSAAGARVVLLEQVSGSGSGRNWFAWPRCKVLRDISGYHMQDDLAFDIWVQAVPGNQALIVTLIDIQVPPRRVRQAFTCSRSRFRSALAYQRVTD